MIFYNFWWKKELFRIIAIMICFCLLVVWMIINKNFWLKWWTWIDIFITFLTLIVAIVVWHQNSRETWKKNLPKRLTVSFQYEGNEIMRCEKAHLTSEADIRALGQQIGRQMAKQINEMVTHSNTGSKQINLDFVAPYIKIVEPEKLEQDEPDKIYVHYRANFELMENPLSKKDEMWVWKEPFFRESDKPNIEKHPLTSGIK